MSQIANNSIVYHRKEYRIYSISLALCKELLSSVTTGNPCHLASTSCVFPFTSWWHHQMEEFSRFTGPLCGDFTGARWIPLTKASDPSFDVLFDLCLNKRLSKVSWGWWFETLSCPLWRHCNDIFRGEFYVPNVLPWCTTLATPSYSAVNTKLKVNRNHLSNESWKDWFTTKYENDIRGGYIMLLRYILMSLVCDLQDFALS